MSSSRDAFPTEASPVSAAWVGVAWRPVLPLPFPHGLLGISPHSLRRPGFELSLLPIAREDHGAEVLCAFPASAHGWRRTKCDVALAESNYVRDSYWNRRFP